MKISGITVCTINMHVCQRVWFVIYSPGLEMDDFPLLSFTPVIMIVAVAVFLVLAVPCLIAWLLVGFYVLYNRRRRRMSGDQIEMVRPKNSIIFVEGL